MPDRERWRGIRPDWGFETRTCLGWTLTAILLLLGITSLVSEGVGWWGDLREIGTTEGIIAGLIVGIATLVLRAGREQATTIRHYVEKDHALLRSSDRKLDTLDEIQLELDAQTGVLNDTRERL